MNIYLGIFHKKLGPNIQLDKVSLVLNFNENINDHLLIVEASNSTSLKMRVVFSNFQSSQNLLNLFYTLERQGDIRIHFPTPSEITASADIFKRQAVEISLRKPSFFVITEGKIYATALAIIGIAWWAFS